MSLIRQLAEVSTGKWAGQGDEREWEGAECHRAVAVSLFVCPCLCPGAWALSG